MWARKDGRAGRHFADQGTDPDTIGISDANAREKVTYEVVDDTEVLETTAADFESGRVQGVGGKGGGQQLIMPVGWEKHLVLVKKQ